MEVGILPDNDIRVDQSLKQYIERIERLELERSEIGESIRNVYSEAENEGFHPKVMRQIVKLRKMDNSDFAEHEMLLLTYKKALGMLVNLDE
ncbi:DUF2312 domain-containing protein [Candidatus Neoehrlichia procyonis]|uniref:GapR-like DNA-binding domain-containing protein n=1 Tax=Candidatus Neoehrlichia procyonis str. RAC413 TaxID=1359163 RepID=A0A0F3NL98_9RICK|nr:DUF2312 domain-containing protein [Candidatus Neoehrlichia lotoris]KJV68810.1 hypothetical protein NLO413_0175 [Candidatus Neoehrlichia lotoris str. RAC413]